MDGWEWRPDRGKKTHREGVNDPLSLVWSRALYWGPYLRLAISRGHGVSNTLSLPGCPGRPVAHRCWAWFFSNTRAEGTTSLKNGVQGFFFLSFFLVALLSPVYVCVCVCVYIHTCLYTQPERAWWCKGGLYRGTYVSNGGWNGWMSRMNGKMGHRRRRLVERHPFVYRAIYCFKPDPPPSIYHKILSVGRP